MKNSVRRATAAFISPVAFCLVLALSNLRHLRAQSPHGEQTASGSLPSFDVASVKLDNNPDVVPSGESTGSLYSVTKQQVAILISIAYDQPGNGYYFGQVMRQLPKWAQTDRFDIEARAAGNPTKDQLHLMLRSLLADRFKFAMHYEVRQSRFYNLVLVKPGKLGPNIHPFGNEPPCPSFPGPPPSSPTVAGGFPTVCGIGRPLEPKHPGLVRIGFRNVSMETFAQYAANAEGPDWTDKDRPVFDDTGLSGTFDFIIEYDRNASANPTTAPVGPTWIEAMRDELGLKLEPATGPLKTFVIDHIEEPTPN